MLQVEEGLVVEEVSGAGFGDAGGSVVVELVREGVEHLLGFAVEVAEGIELVF